ncbi:MAG: triphosphoribosyl-dephospho-CoA synthase [Burkholderiales bacterium]|nr:triphosphoribosyl-dephospho-CoA synthase [Burkholderiales bacterium]
MIAKALANSCCEEIDRFAVWALRREIRLYPKAGLVSLVDCGSHTDMDASTLQVSADVLAGYFFEMAQAGAGRASFRVLNAIGLSAERKMYDATQGINTHRGAIFSLGLLAAAAGLCRTSAAQRCPFQICRTVERRWGPEILAARPSETSSHGSIVQRKYGVCGAREEAAAGFPTIALHSLPAFLSAYERESSVETAGLHAFYASMAVLDDSNVLYRGGPESLKRVKTLAGDFLLRGGIFAADGFSRAVSIHGECVGKNLSPGGSADLLIATLFLAAEAGVVDP